MNLNNKSLLQINFRTTTQKKQTKYPYNFYLQSNLYRVTEEVYFMQNKYGLLRNSNNNIIQ